jgi:GWxTD domain-containing protein
MNRIKFILIVSSLFTFLFTGCSSKTSIPQRNVSIAKETKTNLLNPIFTIYNPSTDSSKIYFKISTQNILYTRKDKLSSYNAQLKIHYQLYPYGNSKLIVDSLSIFLKDEVRTKTNKNLTGTITIPTPDAKDYLLKITTEDLNRGASIEKKIYLRKSYKHNRQYFLIQIDSSAAPVYESFVNDSSRLLLTSEINKDSLVFFRYYNRAFSIAAPPFASINTKSFNYIPDTTIIKKLNSLGNTNFESPQNGFIHIQTDTSTKVGSTLFKYDNNFPKIKTIEGLITPLRYICSTAEYNVLLESSTPKKSVDEFWLSKASSDDRARELIKQYYNRVEQANKHFSSHIEGWKTDRGMISIIYGPPTLVRKTGRSETWIYGEENNLIALNFIFNQKDNPFSDNDYKLQRSSTYKTAWYRAVDTWRSGRVYYGY